MRIYAFSAHMPNAKALAPALANCLMRQLISLQLLAVVRAHITALGGNAMVSFYMSELILVDNPHKNQVIQSILLF